MPRLFVPSLPLRLSFLHLLLLFLVVPLAACAQSDTANAGEDYEVLSPGARWEPKRAGAIEVVELFAYTCGHCAKFQPLVDGWQARKPKDVTWTYVPAVFDTSDPLARGFFASQLAGTHAKTHQAMFDALHKNGALPKNPTLQEVATFFAERGLDRDKMLALMQSKQVDALMLRARQFAIDNRLGQTPSVLVEGRYLVLGDSFEDRLRILDLLIAKQRVPKAASAAAKPAAAP